MNEFLEQFLIESRELVEQAAADLLALEQAPEDRARLDSAFRAFHTLKGAAGIIEFDAMAHAVHAAEDGLAAVRAGERAVSADLISNCLACLDQIVRWLEVMEATEAPPADAEAAATALAAAFALPAAPIHAHAAAAPPAEDRPSWVDELVAACPQGDAARVAILYTPDPDSFFRGDDPLALMARLPGLLALRIEPRQPWSPLDEMDAFACNLVIRAVSERGPEEVAGLLKSVFDQVQLFALEARPNAGLIPDRAAEVLEAQLALVDGLPDPGFPGRMGSAGRVASAVLRHLGLTSQAREIDGAAAASLVAGDPALFRAALSGLLGGPDAHDADNEVGPSAAPAAASDSVARALRVEVGRIDAIVNLTGELIVVKNALGHAVRLAQGGGDAKVLSQTLKDQHAQLDRLTAELQRSVLAIRVLPLRQVFQRFPRLVREMAASLGKSARLLIEGEATEADKVVVEALFEPLLHVVRNAVDHGVEGAEARAAAGKPPSATIRLQGFRDGEHVIVDVSDEGRGIDPDRIRRAAAERGVLSPEALAAMSDEEAVNLIFAPGFSTADTVTDISGRGVGMDAVLSAVERLGGRVSVRSRIGEGTTVRFTLPFTVMMTRVMTVEAAGQVFGVPFDAVVETLQIPRGDITPVGAAEAFVLRGRTVPLVSLAKALDLPSQARTSAAANAVVTMVAGQLGAFEVDRFGERLDVMLKPMDGLLAGMGGVAGATLLGDGRVLLVLDLQELLQ